MGLIQANDPSMMDIETQKVHNNKEENNFKREGHLDAEYRKVKLGL